MSQVTEINDIEFSEKIAGNEKVILKYYADWCGNCKLIAPKYKRLAGDERFAGITFLDVNAENNPEARDAVKVDNLPFFAIYKNGEFIEGAAASKEEFIVSLLEKLNA